MRLLSLGAASSEHMNGPCLTLHPFHHHSFFQDTKGFDSIPGKPQRQLGRSFGTGSPEASLVWLHSVHLGRPRAGLESGSSRVGVGGLLSQGFCFGSKSFPCFCQIQHRIFCGLLCKDLSNASSDFCLLGCRIKFAAKN